MTAPVPARGPQPQAELASYISQVDYPPAALQAHEQGGVGFILTIGADGRVTGCQVTESSGSAALDGATCRIMQSRARYAPALDGNGRPIAGTDVGQVRWALP
jgi:protein TonB